MGRFFRNGTLRQEIVQTYGTSDMVVLAVIERAHVEGLTNPTPSRSTINRQPWAPGDGA